MHVPKGGSSVRARGLEPPTSMQPIESPEAFLKFQSWMKRRKKRKREGRREREKEEGENKPPPIKSYICHCLYLIFPVEVQC